jgi:hypothetical protein
MREEAGSWLDLRRMRFPCCDYRELGRAEEITKGEEKLSE